MGKNFFLGGGGGSILARKHVMTPKSVGYGVFSTAFDFQHTDFPCEWKFQTVISFNFGAKAFQITLCLFWLAAVLCSS